jgi:hypothetical protein
MTAVKVAPSDLENHISLNNHIKPAQTNGKTYPIQLQTKIKVDRVDPKRKEPESINSGLIEPRDSGGILDKVYPASSTLSESPNFYKHNGDNMSKIPYNFRPIPDEFLADEFIDDPIMMRFIRWMFKRISPKHTSVLLKNKKKVDLDPFEFMFGRGKCAEQAGITLKQAENKINNLVGSNLVSKVGSKSGSKYSVYRLVTDSFTQNGGQLNGQQIGQQLGHNQDIRNKEDKKETIERAVALDSPLFEKEEKIKSNDMSEDLKKQKDLLWKFILENQMNYGKTSDGKPGIKEKDLITWINKYSPLEIKRSLDKALQATITQTWPGYVTMILKNEIPKKEDDSKKGKEIVLNFIKNHKLNHLDMKQKYCKDLIFGGEIYYNLPKTTIETLLQNSLERKIQKDEDEKKSSEYNDDLY